VNNGGIGNLDADMAFAGIVQRCDMTFEIHAGVQAGTSGDNAPLTEWSCADQTRKASVQLKLVMTTVPFDINTLPTRPARRRLLPRIQYNTTNQGWLFKEQSWTNSQLILGTPIAHDA
jgi:hypothetical protein